jgi:tetratricopeptide (TPR) repeat protein
MIKKYIILICITFFFNNISFSKTISDSAKNSEEPKGPVKTSDYNLAKKYIQKADKYHNKNKSKKAIKYYNKALKLLYSSNKKYQVNANTFNYLGYANLKLGNFENAEIYYLLGLEIEPKHNSINAYLGKLYVNLNRTDEAKERLNILKSCNCEEFIQLSNSIKLGASKY